METGSQEERTQGGGWRTRVGKTMAGGLGDRPCNPGLQDGKIKPETTD